MPPEARPYSASNWLREQLEFLHRFDRHARLRAAVAAVERVVVVRPVHRVVDVAHVLAGDADRIGAERRRRDRRDDARQHAEIAGEVAIERRRIDEFLRADAPADLLTWSCRRAATRPVTVTVFGQPADFELASHLRGPPDFERARRAVTYFLNPCSSAVTSYMPASCAEEERAVRAGDRFAKQTAFLVADRRP